MRKELLYIALITLCMLVSTQIVIADSTYSTSGSSRYLDLETTFDGYNWAGIKVINDGTPLSESTFPFLNLEISTPTIIESSFPGYNLKGGQYYYASMLTSSFNLLNVKNATLSDLESGQLFPASQYPQFYTSNYYQISDNPQQTFCCNQTNVTLGGINYTAFVLTLSQNVEYYLLKYDNGVETSPLFLTPFVDSICYNSTTCVSEFLLPISNNNYNFFLLGKYPSYDYDIFIDGVQTSTFSQTGLPYDLTVLVKNLYSGQPVPNASILVGETSGQNLFVPYTLTGYVSEAYAVGKTNDQGYETFLVAPTVYPTIVNYSIYVAVLRDQFQVSKEDLYVTSMDALITQKKSFSPSRLLDNAVASVNAMNQIASFLFTWSSQRGQAMKYIVDYNVAGDSFTTYDLQISNFFPNPITLKTGAPNVFTVTVSSTGLTPPTDYSIRIKETDGYLIMNPYTDDAPLTETTRIHTQQAEINQEFIITPTSLGFIDANVTLEILDYTGAVIGSYELPVDANLNIDGSGTFYNNDLLKTIVNAMNQILNSMYNSLN